jgi:hypothetical protein
MVRSADLPLCGEGTTVERSHGNERGVLGSAGKAFMSAMTGLQLRLRAAYAQGLL